jgi:AAA+ superfamily predicted ATPase
MSIRFKQRIKVLPGIYLNVGKNGITTTIGPRGANINIGPNGTYLNTSIPDSGISYRQKLFSGNNNNNDSDIDKTSYVLYKDEIGIEKGIDEIITSSGLWGLKEEIEVSKKTRELLKPQLDNSQNIFENVKLKYHRQKNTFLGKIFSTKISVEKTEINLKEAESDYNELLDAYEESRADIHLTLEERQREYYELLKNEFIKVIDCKAIWEITSHSVNNEVKSSAKFSVEQTLVKFQLKSPDYIKSEFDSLNLGLSDGSNIYIYPAFILFVDTDSEIDILSFSDIQFDFKLQRFIETNENIHTDSKIVEYTWYKVNKDGTRDLRYKNNYQIPVIELGSLSIKSKNGLNKIYYFSNVELSKKFAIALKNYSEQFNSEIYKKDNTEVKVLNIPSYHLIQDYTIEYHNLLLDYAKQVENIIRKLSTDESLIEKVSRTVKDISPTSFFSYLLHYDMCKVVKYLYGGNIKYDSLEMTGLILMFSKLLDESKEDFLKRGFEYVKIMHQQKSFTPLYKNIIETSNSSNPLNINVSRINDNKVVKKDTIKSELSLPSILKILNNSHFEEYATLLYRFANIVSKADNDLTQNEIDNLKIIYKIVHEPLSDDDNRLLTISENNKNETLEEVLNELDSLIGLDEVKAEVKSLINYLRIQREREKMGLKTSSLSYHCVFMGSPGTGKTTIARIVAKLYVKLGILTKGHLVETDRSGLVAEYTGQTAVKVNNTVNSAIDGILFIDEAYSLVLENKDDFGKEAIATLIKRMEDDRERLVVIIAGYTNEMNTFLESNSGLKSRFNRYIEFKDYSPNELESIYIQKCEKLDYKLNKEAQEKLKNVLIDAFTQRDISFGNGRYVRNLFEKTLERQANRIAGLNTLTKEILSTINEEDIPIM